jgi:hypothetical protein
MKFGEFVNSRISDNSKIVVSNQQVAGGLVDGDVAILNLSDGVYYGLNAVGGRIWSLIQQPTTVHAVEEILLQEYDVDPDICHKELLDILEDLADHGLIEVNNDQVE